MVQIVDGVAQELPVAEVECVANDCELVFVAADGGALPLTVGHQATQPLAADDGLEFRQAFVVSVSSAGTFLFPSTTIDPLDFPGNTLLSQAARLEVDIPAGPRR